MKKFVRHLAILTAFLVVVSNVTVGFAQEAETELISAASAQSDRNVLQEEELSVPTMPVPESNADEVLPDTDEESSAQAGTTTDDSSASTEETPPKTNSAADSTSVPGSESVPESTDTVDGESPAVSNSGSSSGVTSSSSNSGANEVSSSLEEENSVAVQKTGWVDAEGQKYYYDGNGQMLKGMQPIDGKWYYLDETTGALWTGGWKQTSQGRFWSGADGVVPYGINSIDGAWYYIDPNTGYLRFGFIDVYSGGRTYANSDGEIKTGWLTVDGKQYYVNSDTKLLVTGTMMIGDVTYKFGADGVLQQTIAKPGWQEIDGKKYYYDENGQMLKGMQPIGGQWYYLDEITGALWTGGWKQNLKGAYFWSGADGVVPYGLNEIEGTWRYIDPNTGYLRFGFIDVYSGGRTYANNDGVIKTGWITVNGKQYYVKPETRLLATGTLTIGDITYKFGEDGALQQTISKPGWHEVNGQKYYYDGNGQMLKGMQPIGGQWYYLDETTGALWTGGWKQNLKGAYFWSDADGIVPYGLNEIEGTWRYIDPNTGYLRFGFIDVYSGGRTYANNDGVIKTGWITVNGKQYYVKPDTRLLATGTLTIGDITYKFGEDGALLQTITKPGWHEVNGQKYYYDENGQMLKGMQPIGGQWYYLDETTGALWTGGWKQNLKGAYFWSGADGIVPYGLNEIEGTWRYIDPNTGYLRFGFIDVYSGGRTYANNDGVIKTGWITVNGKQYYVKPDTRLLATGTLTIGDITYKFGEDGALQQTISKPGWQEIDGKKYYYDENGQMLKGMQPIGGQWYYLDEITGALWTGGWKQNLKGAYFWSGADGVVPYGLNEIEGTWRYIDPNTGYLRFGFIDVYSGGRTYANSEGVIKTGWITVDGKQYYVDPDTKLLLTGWQTVGGQKYYFDATGQQLKGMQPINGYWYYLDETTGVLWTSGWKQLSGGKIWSDATGKIPLGYQVVDGYWRYFSVNTGYLQTGFFIVHTGGQSYADTEGRVTAGWKNINGKFYCIDDKTLEFVKGWVELDGNRFYFKSDYTGATGPYKIDGNWYYFEYKWGSLVRNTTVVIDGVSYQVDANGVIQNYFPDKAYGIDVSSHQGVIDWQQVANSGVSFAMIRALTWSNSANYYVIDPYFEVNVRNAKANGIKVGVYLYSYAFSEAEIEEEVFFFLNSAELKRLRDDGIVFDYPVYIDYEDPLVINNVPDPQRKTDIVRHGMNILDQNGYLPGFYTYDYFARSLMNAQQLINEGYEFWVAHTSATSNPWGDAAGIWQYSHTGKVPGIQGNVDLNYAYKNYPSIINPGGGTTPDPVGETLSVYDSVTGKTVTDSVENILAAIVQAEVGGTKLTGLDARTLFQAQAVAAHSWILFSQNNGESYPSVVLASQDKITSAVRQAVAQVANYVVMYNGIPACTVYGSASAGVTNSSQNMGWNSQPYLVNVTSPYESMYGAAWQNKTNTIGIARMKDNIENKLGISTAGYDYANWLTNPVFDQYGYCTQITVCGKVVSGGKFYENCYGLYSPNFTFQYLGSTQGWKFVTQGNGHCVGMSQYGAMGYAANGYTWQQILQHYYPGTTITTIK